MDKKEVEEPKREVLAEGTRRLDDSVKEHPYATLAAAVGLGYVLGGGLFTRLTVRLLKVAVTAGASMALGPLVVAALAPHRRNLGALPARAGAEEPEREGQSFKRH